MDLNQLESHLWESANILRGPVDAADFKTYIFPLLFFKRICDVWDEEYQEIVDETGDEQLACFPESHRFQIPEDCHWNDVRTKASNVGAALQHAMREIEKANPETLYAVFGDAQWSNKDRLSDALLKDLIEHFSKLPFGNRHVTSDLLGDALQFPVHCRSADAEFHRLSFRPGIRTGGGHGNHLVCKQFDGSRRASARDASFGPYGGAEPGIYARRPALLYLRFSPRLSRLYRFPPFHFCYNCGS